MINTRDKERRDRSGKKDGDLEKKRSVKVKHAKKRKGEDNSEKSEGKM